MTHRIQNLPVFLIGSILVVLFDQGLAAPNKTGIFHQQVAAHRIVQVGLPSSNVVNVFGADGVIVETDMGFAVWADHQWRASDPVPSPSHPAVPAKSAQLNANSDRSRWVLASEKGLFEYSDHQWEKLRIDDGLGRIWADHDVRGAAYDNLGRLWFATLAGVGVRNVHGTWDFFEGKDGLPYNDFTCVESVAGGGIWFGTRRGAIYYDGDRWAYRQGLRWLPGDDVRAIHVDGDNTAWFATDAGVGCIKQTPITLEQKAAFYEDEIERHIKRTEFGYVATARLSVPGEKTTISNVDNDNDGQCTVQVNATLTP